MKTLDSMTAILRTVARRSLLPVRMFGYLLIWPQCLGFHIGDKCKNWDNKNFWYAAGSIIAAVYGAVVIVAAGTFILYIPGTR